MPHPFTLRKHLLRFVGECSQARGSKKKGVYSLSKKGFLTHIFGLILILISLFLGPPVNAGSIFEAPKVSIPKPEEVVPSEYSFIAKFNSEKTQLQPFGDGWETTHFTWGNGTVETYLSLRPTQSQKGMNGVVYSHVGSFGGKIIDLKITIKDWQQFSRYQGYISYSKEDISHFAQGYDFVDQEWAFVDHATGLPIAVSGFMTINDIDGGQGFQFSKETFEAITHIYVAD